MHVDLGEDEDLAEIDAEVLEAGFDDVVEVAVGDEEDARVDGIARGVVLVGLLGFWSDVLIVDC
jgi:hypothetical protein